jgi:hypothetical protein
MLIKIPMKFPISKEKKMIKGHNLMDLAFFILKMYMSCTEIHVHIAPDYFMPETTVIFGTLIIGI